MTTMHNSTVAATSKDAVLISMQDALNDSLTIAPSVTRYFTFGHDHSHFVGGRFWDKDTVVSITAPNPRHVMFATFGKAWAFEYLSLEDVDMRFYHGVWELEI